MDCGAGAALGPGYQSWNKGSAGNESSHCYPADGVLIISLQHRADSQSLVIWNCIKNSFKRFHSEFDPEAVLILLFKYIHGRRRELNFLGSHDWDQNIIREDLLLRPYLECSLGRNTPIALTGEISQEEGVWIQSVLDWVK